MDKIPYINTINWFRKLSKIDDTAISVSYCLPAVRNLSSRTKSKKTVVDNEPALCFLAAVMAYYKFSLTEDFTRFSRLRAGEVTLDMPCDEQKATLSELLKTAVEDARPFLKGGVIFKSVKGGGSDD